MKYLKDPPPLIQWSATVLSLLPCTDVIGYPSSAVLTLSTRFAAMCAATNSNFGIVRFFFANPDFAAINPLLTLEA